MSPWCLKSTSKIFQNFMYKCHRYQIVLLIYWTLKYKHKNMRVCIIKKISFLVHSMFSYKLKLPIDQSSQLNEQFSWKPLKERNISTIVIHVLVYIRCIQIPNYTKTNLQILFNYRTDASPFSDIKHWCDLKIIPYVFHYWKFIGQKRKVHTLMTRLSVYILEYI